MPDQALVLCGHGSHHDPAPAAVLSDHAGRLRAHGAFDAVRAAYWKGQPGLAEILWTVEATTTYVVPMLTSEGYFADEVFPRELGRNGVEPGGQVRYTEPVGTHESVVDVVLDRVEAALAGTVPDEALGVALVGHGTERHAESGAATRAHVERLRALDRFAAVEALFLDQAPRVAGLAEVFDVDEVVAVPFFVADGPHVTRDVPAAIGLPEGEGVFDGPHAVDGRRVWYTRAVGTAPSLSTVILERAADAGAEVGVPGEPSPALATTERAFLAWLRADAPAARTWGELAVQVGAAGGSRYRYELRHRDDRGAPAAGLEALAMPAAVRAHTETNEAGRYRPLRTERSLRTGWRFETTDPATFVGAVRAVYPGGIDLWHRGRSGTLEATGFDAVAARQTGRYADLDGLSPADFDAAVTACCGDCVRRPAWTEGPVSPAVDAGSFPCPTPCSVLLETVRSGPTDDEPEARPAP